MKTCYVPTIVLLGIISLCCGCAGVAKYGMAGAEGAAIYTNVTHPGQFDTGTTSYTFAPNDYKIIGPVRGTGKSVNVLGIVASGNSGLTKAMEQVDAKGADDIINLKLDTSVFSILGLFTMVTTEVNGVAVKWKAIETR